jgi:chromosome partitioning protein
MIRITFGNQKGGVAKSTTALCVARRWADLGLRVLLIDADPQGNILSMVKAKPELYLNDFLFGKMRLADCIVTPAPRLDIICSNRDTFEAEQRMSGMIGRERILESQFSSVDETYDAVIVDVSPSLSLLQIGSLVYTRDFICPINMDTLAVTGANGMFTTADDLLKTVKVGCRCVAFIPTIVDFRYQNTEMVLKAMQAVAKLKDIPVLHAVRTDATVLKANRQRQFVVDVDPKSKAVEDYKIVAQEILDLYGVTVPEDVNASAASQLA